MRTLEQRKAHSEFMKKWNEEHPQTEEQQRTRSEKVRKYHVEHPWTEEQRRVISERNRKRWSDSEQRRVQSEKMTRRNVEHPVVWTPEQKQAISEGVKRSYIEHPGRRRADSERKKKWHKEQPEESQRLMENARKHSRYSNTIIERKMKAILEGLKFDFKHQGRIVELSGRIHLWDFLVPSLKIAIEVDGCWWHGCSIHCPDSPYAGSKKEKKRDDEARLLGWKVFRVWEHEFDSVEKIHENLITLVVWGGEE